ncbi:hypothetical protein U2F10_00775 [Leptothoe sp. EHU-05/26/07-4]
MRSSSYLPPVRWQRDFEAADDIRDWLTAMGITLVDQPDGKVRWHR